MRLDKWLWHARFFKTRTLASAQVQAGVVRVDGVRVTKAATSVGSGATLTFAQGDRIRVIRVLGLGERRGPAGEAQGLYLDLDPVVPGAPAQVRADAPAPGFDGNAHGGGRPGKKDRRVWDNSRRDALE